MWEELARESDEPYMREMAERYIEKLRSGDKEQDSKVRPARPEDAQENNDI
jgi:hypothetical protein